MKEIIYFFTDDAIFSIQNVVQNSVQSNWRQQFMSDFQFYQVKLFGNLRWVTEYNTNTLSDMAPSTV